MKDVIAPKSYRVFVALPLPEEVNAKLSALQQWLRRETGGDFVRWVRAEKFRLTIRFFGDLPAAKLPALEAAVRQTASLHQQIELTATGAGWFGHRQQPGVIWAGITGDVKALRALESAIDRATDLLGARRDPTPFEPHLTLGRASRCSGDQSRRLKEVIASKANAALGSWRADTLLLLRSDLLPTGADYTELNRFELGRRVEREAKAPTPLD